MPDDRLCKESSSRLDVSHFFLLVFVLFDSRSTAPRSGIFSSCAKKKKIIFFQNFSREENFTGTVSSCFKKKLESTRREKR